MARSCGPCTACCDALVIPELDKPAFSECPHAIASGDAHCSGGCATYRDRPKSCSNFRCLWLDGHLGDGDRPDELGVIFTTAQHHQLGTLPMLIEVRPGGAATPAVREAIQRLARQSHVIVSTPAGGRIHWRTPAAESALIALTVRGSAA